MHLYAEYFYVFMEINMAILEPFELCYCFVMYMQHYGKTFHFLVFNYELIYELKLKIFTRVIKKNNFSLYIEENLVYFILFFYQKLNKELEFHFFLNF